MPVIARDAVASDHLVYAWPFPIGPDEYDITCADDEQVVMCPSWLVGDRLGPGRHRWRTQDPMRPVSAYFVLTAPVEVSFDMTTSFQIPATGQPIRLRGAGSLQVRCADPGLLIAQFVGLPFDGVNEGILRSVTRSVERMLARLLTRRVVMANTPAAVTDPTMLANIIEELIAYNPAAGAVFGIELMRMGHLAIYADDGSQSWDAMQPSVARSGPNGETARVKPPEADTERGARKPSQPSPPPAPPMAPTMQQPPLKRPVTQSEASGEFTARPKKPTVPPAIPSVPARVITTPAPGVVPPPVSTRRAASIEVPETDDITQPGVQIVRTPVPGAILAGEIPSAEPPAEARGSILGIGVGHIGSASAGVVSGEITRKIAPGARVLVAGPNGLMQSATVRQLLQGYYELEVGSSGETIWVPMSGVVPE